MTQPFRRYFSSGEVIRLTTVTYRRLDLWCRRGIIQPSGRNVAGKGQRRLFTFRDIIEIQTLKALTARGVRLAALIECVARIRKDLADSGEHSFATVRLITDGKTVFRYIPASEQLESMDAFGQFAFAFGLGDEITALTRGVAQLDRRSRYVRRSDKQDATKKQVW